MLCTTKFFGSKQLPVIDISDAELEVLANESVNKGLTVTGVQKKLSMHLSQEKSPRLTLVGYPAGYILKPQSSEYECLPEAEDLVMDIAAAMGVKTVPHGLIKMGERFAYITKRIDRSSEKSFAMEDFCQLSQRLTEDKYKSSYEKCAGIIKAYSTRPGLDLSEFFLRLVVSYVTGNSDMHLKNFSLIETSPGNRQFVLSEAYDMLPVNLVLPEDTDETALTLREKRSNFKKEDFLQFAQSCGIPDSAAQAMIKRCIKSLDKAINICEESYITPAQKSAFIALMTERIEKLK